MPSERELHELQDFAVSLAPGGLTVHRALVALDERQNGEPVTRLVLLLDEPRGDTWEVKLVRAQYRPSEASRERSFSFVGS
jgi:hypothetical protein